MTALNTSLMEQEARSLSMLIYRTRGVETRTESRHEGIICSAHKGRMTVELTESSCVPMVAHYKGYSSSLHVADREAPKEKQPSKEMQTTSCSRRPEPANLVTGKPLPQPPKLVCKGSGEIIRGSRPELAEVGTENTPSHLEHAETCHKKRCRTDDLSPEQKDFMEAAFTLAHVRNACVPMVVPKSTQEHAKKIRGALPPPPFSLPNRKQGTSTAAVGSPHWIPYHTNFRELQPLALRAHKTALQGISCIQQAPITK